MADINLNIKLLDVNVAKASERLLKSQPNDEKVPKDGAVPQEDGSYAEEDLELKYPTTKAWAEELCKRALYRHIRVGHQMLQREADDALESQDDYLS